MGEHTRQSAQDNYTATVNNFSTELGYAKPYLAIGETQSVEFRSATVSSN